MKHLLGGYPISAIENESTGEISISENVKLMGRWDKGIENNGGIIYMNGGHIETSGQGEYSYAIYNEGGTVEISEGAVTLPRNYGVD